ncbi:non-ribosomal peptide synthetase [Streptomyces sp. NPDC003038]|uniref:non-ribosomal peptide synthetase n=1 Tax=unclassified Streptomyces TaxID=2593676 RepID=UPI0033A8726F
MEPGPGGVHLLVADRAAKTPDACAVREAVGGATLSYRELWDRAGAVTAALVGRGVGPGALVALDLDRGNNLIVALLGVVRAGAAYLPVDGHAPEERVTGILKDAGVRAVIVGSGADRRARPLNVAASTAVLTVPEALAAAAPDAGAAGADTPGGAVPGSDAPVVAVDEESPCYVGYTSGSTGAPKGVVIPHRAIRDLVTDPEHGAITSDDRMGQLANPAFDAFTWEVWGALIAGATLVVMPSVVEIDLERWTSLLADEGISTALLTTSLFHMVAREAPASLQGLRQLLVGGEQMDMAATLAVLAAGPPARLTNIYGPTETTVLATYYDCTPESLAGRTRIPVGHPVRAAELYVVDQDLRPVAPGETGELLVGGPSVATGYLNNPERTARSFLPHRSLAGVDGLRYRTGDLVRLLPGGIYEVVGRADRQVKLRGFRIELEEVELAATATGRTTAAFVEKTGDGHAARLVGAFLADPAHPGGPKAQGRELADALCAALPSYMLPARWLPLAELPYGSTGKADRSRIRQLLAESAPAAGAEAAGAATATAGAATAGAATAEDRDTGPRDPVRAAVEQVWIDLLGTPEIDPAEDFIGLGGNSILATQAAFRIGERLGIALDPTEVLLAASLTDLADRLRDQV